MPNFFEQFPEFNFFAGGNNESPGPDAEATLADDKVISRSTPDELLRATIREVEDAIAVDLIARICNASPAFFERLVVDLLLAMGYGGSRAEAGRALGKSGDGGIDGVIDQDQLGLDRIYIQAKKYSPENGVSEPEIRGFSGSLGANKANKGVFVTTSYFTNPAHEFADRHPFKIVLIDGAELARLMIRYSVGVRTVETLHIKKLGAAQRASCGIETDGARVGSEGSGRYDFGGIKPRQKTWSMSCCALESGDAVRRSRLGI